MVPIVDTLTLADRPEVSLYDGYVAGCIRFSFTDGAGL